MLLNEIQKRIGISRLADVTGLDVIGLPVVAAVRPFTRNLSVSFGKGNCFEQACVSAVMEAAELFFAERPPQPLLMARYCDITDEALDPRCLQQLDHDDDVAAVRFSWTEGHHRSTGSPILVPWEVVSMDFTDEARSSRRHLNFGATGLAAGFDEDRAILHGLYEVIERNAHDAWNQWADLTRLESLVGIRSIEDLETLTLIDKIQHADLDVVIWDMTDRVGVPCYLVEILSLRNQTETPYVQGAAADLSPAMAIRRALTEAIQIRLTYISGSRDDLEWTDYGQRYDHMLENRRQLLKVVAGTHLVPAHDAQSPSAKGKIAEVSLRLRAAGFEDAIVVRLTAANDPVHVVKVIVPSLRDVKEVNFYRPPIVQATMVPL
jgi:YcaO-like protein with predicted kinase domain